MRYISIRDAEYWTNPARFAHLTLDNVLPEGTSPQEWQIIRSSRITQFVLGDPNDDAAPLTSVSQAAPLGVVPYHAHGCNIMMLVIEGSLYLPDRVLYPGDCLVAGPHEFYGPEVAGPAGCTRAEFFAAAHGAFNVEFRLRDGRIVTQHLLEGDRIPSDLAGMEVLEHIKAAIRADAAALGAG